MALVANKLCLKFAFSIWDCMFEDSRTVGMTKPFGLYSHWTFRQPVNTVTVEQTGCDCISHLETLFVRMEHVSSSYWSIHRLIDCTNWASLLNSAVSGLAARGKNETFANVIKGNLGYFRLLLFSRAEHSRVRIIKSTWVSSRPPHRVRRGVAFSDIIHIRTQQCTCFRKCGAWLALFKP